MTTPPILPDDVRRWIRRGADDTRRQGDGGVAQVDRWMLLLDLYVAQVDAYVATREQR